MRDDDSHGRRYAWVHLALAAISAVATIAGVMVALLATDTIVISSPGSAGAETTQSEPLVVPETVVETVTVPPPAPDVRVTGPCNREPNEQRIEATPISLGVCRAAVETGNDRDWYLFQSPRGGQVKVVVERAETKESGDVIAASLYEREGGPIATEIVASDEPFVFAHTLPPESELAIRIEDGCAPACEPAGYALKIE